MPIFEYKCRDCGTVFEELVPQSQKGTLPCSKCKSGNTEKLMSVFGALAHGSPKDTPCGSTCPSASLCSSSGSCCSMAS